MNTKICGTCGIEKPISEFYIYKNKCKSCIVIYMHNWHANNSSKNKEYQQKWYDLHPNEAHIHSRKWAIANTGRTKEIGRKWRDNHPLKVRMNCREWAVKHHEEKKLYDIKYRSINKGKIRIYKNKYRAARLNSPGNGITMGEWEQLKEEYRYQCVYCGKTEPEIKLTLDHIEPLCAGGAHDISNAVLSCKSCNSKKQSKSLLLWLYEREQNG